MALLYRAARHQSALPRQPLEPIISVISHRVRRNQLASRKYRSLGRKKRKPPVLSTADVCWLAELAVMRVMSGVTLGNHVDIRHGAPAVRGAMVTVMALLLDHRDDVWTWRVQLSDEHETIAYGTLDFVDDIDVPRFQRRLDRKRPPLRVLMWMRLLDTTVLLLALAGPLEVVTLWHSHTSALVTETAALIGWLISLTGVPAMVSDWFMIRIERHKHRVTR